MARLRCNWKLLNEILRHTTRSTWETIHMCERTTRQVLNLVRELPARACRPRQKLVMNVHAKTQPFVTPKDLGQGGNEQYIGSRKLCRELVFTTPMAPQGRLSHNAPSNTVQETEVCFHSRPHASILVNIEKRCGIFRPASNKKEAMCWKRDGQWKNLLERDQQ